MWINLENQVLVRTTSGSTYEKVNCRRHIRQDGTKGLIAELYTSKGSKYVGRTEVWDGYPDFNVEDEEAWLDLLDDRGYEPMRYYTFAYKFLSASTEEAFNDFDAMVYSIVEDGKNACDFFQLTVEGY